MNSLTIALLTGLIGMLCWGGGDYFASVGLKKRVSEEAGNFWLNISGVLFCVIVFSIYSLVTGKVVDMPSLTFADVLNIILLATMNFVGYLFFFKALKVGELSVISSVFSTYAAGAVFVSALVFGESISTFRLMALAIVIIGIILVAVGDVRNFKKAKGILLVIPAVIVFAIFFPLWDSIAQKGGSFVLVILLDTVLMLEYFAYAKFKSQNLVYKSAQLRPFIFGGILTTIAALSVSWGYEHTSMPSVVSVVSSAVPVTSAFLGYFILKERLRFQQNLGLVAIVIGVILLFIFQ